MYSDVSYSYLNKNLYIDSLSSRSIFHLAKLLLFLRKEFEVNSDIERFKFLANIRVSKNEVKSLHRHYLNFDSDTNLIS